MTDISKFHSVAWIITDSIKGIFKFVIGAIHFAWLLFRKKQTHYVLMSVGMGDTLCALSYLREYKYQSGFDHITVVGCPSAISQTCCLYEGLVNDIIYISRRSVNCLRYFALSSIGQKCCAFLFRDRITVASYYCHLTPRVICNNPYLSLTDFMKTFLFQLGPDAVIERPHIPETDISAFVSKYQLTKGKTVIMNPYANSVSLDVTGLFKRIAYKLFQEGYTVVSLTKNDSQKPIDGTKAIVCNLPEAFHLAEYAGTVIGLRSGFLDYVLFSKSKIIAIDDYSYELREFYKLEKWNINPDCHSIVFEDEEKTYKKALSLLEIKNIERGE